MALRGKWCSGCCGEMPGDVRVQTFCEGDERGRAARPFYRSLGFAPDRLSDFNGYPEQDFVLKR